MAVGFTIVCAVCVFAAPTQLNYDGVNVPAGLSQAGLDTWAADHADEVICNFPYRGGPIDTGCGQPGPRRPGTVRGGPGGGPVTQGPGRAHPVHATDAGHDQVGGGSGRRTKLCGLLQVFLSPSVGLMIRTGLWIELEAVVGFMVGLGLGSLLGQRTVAVVLMIVLEIILTPILSRANIPHLINLQRSVVGLAVAHLEPSGSRIRLRRGGRARGRPRHRPTGAGVEDGGCLRHRRLAGRVDGPRCLADGEAGRLTALTGSTDGHTPLVFCRRGERDGAASRRPVGR